MSILSIVAGAGTAEFSQQHQFVEYRISESRIYFTHA